MRSLALLAIATMVLLFAACDSGSGDDGGTQDTASGQPDVTIPADVGESCEPACDSSLCLVCQAGDCVSSCKADEECVDGVCEAIPQECEPACGDCESCVEGACVTDCTGDEQCHDGVCEVPPAGCSPACGDCERCDDSDIWAPACVSTCTGEQICHDGVCEVPPSCNPECSADACEVCDDSDIWNPSCATTCDTASCQACDGAGSCVGQCVAAHCEACDGAGTCATTCDTADCQTCDGAGGCVTSCNTYACEVCDGAGGCASSCTELEYCDAGTCVERPELTCEDEDGYCPGAVADTLAVAPSPTEAGLEACCCDLTGDGKTDNQLGELLNILGGLPDFGYDRAYFNEQIQLMIERGHLIYLFEPLGVDDTASDPYVKFHVYEGVDADGWYWNNLDGGAEFLVSRSSLDRDGNPLMPFDDATISGGTLYGGPSRFVVPMDLIGSGEPIIFMMEGARITGDITEAAVGYDIANGTVCGYVERSKIVSEVNEYAAMNCGCLDLATDYLTDYGTQLSCGQSASVSTCDTTDNVEYLCQQLYDNCGLLSTFLPAIFDVDANGDGTADAMSVGFTFSAVSADLVGLEPEEQ